MAEATQLATCPECARGIAVRWSGPPEPLNLYADSPVWTAIATAVLAAAGPDSTGGQGESVTEPGAMAAVCVGTVVRSASGTIACRYNKDLAVLFGDERPVPWYALSLPLRVLWDPRQPVEEADAPLWRCDHYSHDTERCTPTKHYPRTTP